MKPKIRWGNGIVSDMNSIDFEKLSNDLLDYEFEEDQIRDIEHVSGVDAYGIIISYAVTNLLHDLGIKANYFDIEQDPIYLTLKDLGIIDKVRAKLLELYPPKL